MMDIKMPTPEQLAGDCGLNRFGSVQKRIDAAVITWCAKYAPHRTGQLARSPWSASSVGSGIITYPGPYAHYQYYGVLYTDERGRTWVGRGETKPVNTGIPLNHIKGYSFWFDRAMADHMQDVIQEALQQIKIDRTSRGFNS